MDEADLYLVFRALANVQEHLGAAAPAPAPEATSSESMEVDSSGLPAEVVAKINETSER